MLVGAGAAAPASSDAGGRPDLRRTGGETLSWFALGFKGGKAPSAAQVEAKLAAGEQKALGEIKKAFHGNSRASTKAQHGYEIVDTTTGEVVKTGVSGGRRTVAGGSYRANSQANRWNREAGQPGRYQPRVVKEVPAGPGAREQILKWEAENAAGLRESGHLTDPSKHVRP